MIKYSGTVLLKNKKKDLTDFLLVILSVVILFSLLIPLLIMNKYNHPATFDDFSNLYAFSNAPTETLFSPLKIGLRYSTFFNYFFYWSLKISPTSRSLHRFIFFYRAWSVFIILLYFFSIFILFFAFNKYFLKTKQTILLFIYSLFMFSLVNYIDRFAFLFYDIVSTSYTQGLCLLIILISCIPAYYYSNEKKMVIALLAFICCGLIEYYTVFVAYIAFIVVCIKYYKLKKIDCFMSSIILFSFIIAICYAFSPWSHEKASIYSGATENIYKFNNFLLFAKSIIKFFIYALQDYLSLKLCIYNLILIIFTATVLNKRQITISILFYISFFGLICLVSLSLFVVGIFYVYKKATSVMIFRFFTFIILTLFFAQCMLFIYVSVVKLFKRIDITNAMATKLNKLFISKKAICNISFFAFLFIFFINIVLFQLPIKNIIYEIYKGSAKTYNSQVWQIYKDLLGSKEDTVEIYQPDVFIQTSLIQGIWTRDIYENYNEWLIPEEKFFNKKIIIKTK